MKPVRMKLIYRLLLASVFFFFVLPSFGATITSTATGGNWNVAGSWLGGAVPAAGDNVIIATTLGNTINLTTNQSCTNLTISGTGILNLNTNGITLSVGGTLTLSGTGAINGNGTTRVVNVANSFSVSAGATATIQNVALSVTAATVIDGTLTFNTGNTAAKTFGIFNISSTGTFNNTASNVPITILSNMINNGTFNQGTGRVTFAGSTTNTVTGTAATTAFGGGITVNKGTSQANLLDVQCVITMSNGGLTLTNGTFRLSSASTITPFTSDPNYGATAQLWCNGGTMNSTVSTNWTFDGTLQVSAGTINFGIDNTNRLIPNNGAGGIVNISGGALNCSGRISLGGTWTYIMTGGVLTVGTIGNTGGFYPFNMSNTGSTFSMSGGTIVIASPDATTGLNGYINYATLGTGFTGGTLQIGNASTPAASIIEIDTTIPIYNLTVSSANATAQVQTQAITVSNNVTISSGTLAANTFDISVGGNWTNNATFTPTTASVTLNGTAQTIGGTSSTTFNNLVLATAASTTTLGIKTIIANNLNIANTAIINPGSITTHTARTLTALNAGQAIGTWGSTSSTATNQNNAIFTAGTTGIITVSNRMYYSRQTGNWNAITTWSTVTYANATNTGTFPVAGDDVNIGGGNFTVTANVNSACGSLSYQSNVSFSPVVTISSGSTLNVSGAITIPRASNINPDVNTFDVGAGTLNAGSLAFTNGGGGQRHVMTILTGTATISGDVTQVGSFGSATITFNGAGTLNLGGAFLDSSVGTLNIATGCTVNYNGAAQIVGDFTYYNLTLSGSGAKDLSTQTTVTTINNNLVMSGTATAAPVSALTIGGSVTLGAGTTFTAGALTHNVAVNWTNNGATFNNTGSTINFNGASAQAIGGTSVTTFNNMILSGANTVSFMLTTTIAGNLTQNTGAVINPSIYDHFANSYTQGGIGKAPGFYGSTSATVPVANQSNTFFTPGTTGRIYVLHYVYYSRQTGNWNTLTSWSTTTYNNATNIGTFPGAGDDVYVGTTGGAITITVNGTYSCGTLTFYNNGSNNVTVTLSGTNTLNVSNVITINESNGGSNNRLDVLAGTLTAGSLAFNNTAAGNGANSIRLRISTGTATITGDVTSDGGNGSTDPTITFTAGGLLQVGGAFLNSNSCTFNQGTGTVEYNGTVAQTIGDFTYYKLKWNNSSLTIPQLTLFNNTIFGFTTLVTNNLNMTSGVVNLNAAPLTLGSGAVASLTRTASTTTNWMYGGTLIRYWAAATPITSTSGSYYGLFPMGYSIASSYRPVEINSTANPTGAGTYSVTHTNSTGTTDLSPVYNDAGTNIVRIDNSQFIGSVAGVTGGTYTINVTMTGLNSTGNLSDIRLAVFTGGTTASAVGTYAAATGSAANPTAIRTGLSVTNLSNDFRISSTNASATPLPIELLSFSGEVKNYGVNLFWNTASELNNDYFTVSRSETGTAFSSIGTVKGNGTTNAPHAYLLTDYKPVVGKNYYQLEQTDFDGQATASEIIVVDVLSLEPMVSIYPNPLTQNQLLNVVINGLPANTPTEIQIVNMQGIRVNEATLTTGPDGTFKAFLSPAGLSPGLYILNVDNLHFKFIIE